MENALVVLVFVVAIIYKIYTNFKKEQAAAAKRSPQYPPAGKTTIDKAKTIYPKATIPPPIAQDPKYNTWDSIEQPTNQAQIPEEVLRIRKQREQQLLQKKKAEVKAAPTSNTEKTNTTFDLRQAVIQSIILERPYK